VTTICKEDWFCTFIIEIDEKKDMRTAGVRMEDVGDQARFRTKMTEPKIDGINAREMIMMMNGEEKNNFPIVSFSMMRPFFI